MPSSKPKRSTRPHSHTLYKIGRHQFTMLDVAKVRRGVEKATCRHCNGYARVLSGKVGRPQAGRKCDECEAARARLRLLADHMRKEGVL